MARWVLEEGTPLEHLWTSHLGQRLRLRPRPSCPSDGGPLRMYMSVWCRRTDHRISQNHMRTGFAAKRRRRTSPWSWCKCGNSGTRYSGVNVGVGDAPWSRFKLHSTTCKHSQDEAVINHNGTAFLAPPSPIANGPQSSHGNFTRIHCFSCAYPISEPMLPLRWRYSNNRKSAVCCGLCKRTVFTVTNVCYMFS